jgi:serine/threonine protein kinase
MKEDKRIEDAMKHLKSLNHPCIVPIIRWEGPQNGIGPATWTEYQANGSLEDVLKAAEMQGNCCVLTHTQMTIITIGLVVGMNYLHKSGVIHGLMKPSDILIDEKYRSRISDFVTMRMDRLKAIRASQVGSPCYMAPEVYDDHYDQDQKVDVFAFGVILYELLMCRKLFAANRSPASVMREIMTGIKREFSGDIHKNVVFLIKKCWNVNAKHRPTFSEILNRLQTIQYKIFADVNLQEIRAYIDEMQVD